VLRTAVGHRLAKVQGYLFKAAFLRRVPTFTRLIIENLILCFLQSAVYQTSKYFTGSLSLRFRKKLTNLVHADYFEVHLHICSASALIDLMLLHIAHFPIASIPPNIIKNVVNVKFQKEYPNILSISEIIMNKDIELPTRSGKIAHENNIAAHDLSTV
jgi:hypothetical protein